MVRGTKLVGWIYYDPVLHEECDGVPLGELLEEEVANLVTQLLGVPNE